MKILNFKKIASLLISLIFFVAICSTVQAASNTDVGEEFSYMFDDTENFVYISWDYSKNHSGINITSTSYDSPILNAPIKSVCDGTVVFLANNHKSAGNYIVIENSDKIKVSYMLMAEPTPLKVGDAVKKGQTIVGYVGKSGNATGANLLISIFKTENGNPSEYWATAKNSLDPKEFFPNIEFIGKNLNSPIPSLSTNSENADSDTSKKYKTEADFLNSVEGVSFQVVAYKAAKAMLCADPEELGKYLLDPNKASKSLEGFTDIFDNVEYLFLVWSLDSIKSDDEIHASYRYAVKGEDSVSYVTMELVKVDDIWKVRWLGIEK